jgi:hypothetical protein
MIWHLGIVVIMALVATGAYHAQQPGMILSPLLKVWAKLPKSLEYPLWDCPVCMCSLWGIPTALIVAPHLWPYLPIHLLASAGLAAYLNK